MTQKVSTIDHETNRQKSVEDGKYNKCRIMKMASTNDHEMLNLSGG